MNTIKKSNLAIFQEGMKNLQTIVFIHGFPFDHKMWSEQVDYFKKYCHCVTYDVRGMGESPSGDGQFTMESFVDDLFEIMDRLNLDKPVLCGLSMGGYIALRAIEREERRFGGVVLCDTKSEADSNEGKINRAKGIKEINNSGVTNFVNNFAAKCFSEDFIKNSKNKYENILNRANKSEPAGVKGCLLAMAARTDTTNSLSKIKIPVLLICGEIDTLTPPEVMTEMTNKINHSEFVLIPKSGHVSAVENPQAFNSALERFLKTKLLF